jgi:hypothetical protein
MRKYSVKMSTLNLVYSYHIVEAKDLKDFSTKVRELMKLHPEKSVMDFIEI